MHIVIFGLTVSSSWGNGHATLWRSLIQSLLARGHTLTFYERDTPYYAQARDLTSLPAGATLRLYDFPDTIRHEAMRELADADVALCTSFCPDGALVSEWILSSPSAMKVFYDLDTPVTLKSLNDEATQAYLPQGGLSGFDLVLSFTGGRALVELQEKLGARHVAALYGWVAPAAYRPVPPVERFRAEFSYLGTYAADRQKALEELFLKPAEHLPERTFLIGGAQYPDTFPWRPNLHFAQHLEPGQHAEFFSSSRATLNVTRRAMAEYGYCPSGRLFEATACGAPMFSDTWQGFEQFFTPGTEVLCVSSARDVLDGLSLSDAELQTMALAARTRTLAEHTADTRVLQLERLLEDARRGVVQHGAVSQQRSERFN